MEYEGIDTETIRGYARIIASSKEYQNVSSYQDIIDFLFQKEYKNKIFMLWNLRYDAESIIKYLLKESHEDKPDMWRIIGKELQTFQGYYDKKSDTTVSYIPNKMLKFIAGKKSNNHHHVVMYDIAQFYEWMRLDDAAKMYLGTTKQDTANWIEKSIEYSEMKITLEQLESYFYRHNKKIGNYCQDDALKTLQLTEYMEQSFQSLGYPFDNPMSNAKLLELYELRNFSYPRITDKMNETHNFVRQSFHGGMFESRIRGMIEDEVFEYDINSAYPYYMSKLDHLGNGKLWKVDKPTDKANMGWYLCEFDCRYIPYKKDIPFILTIILDLNVGHRKVEIPVSKESSFYCSGIRKQVITKIELDFLKKYNYHVKAFNGIEWYKDSNEFEKPFAWMENAYEQRREIKNKNPDDIRQKTLKRMYNSGYGKTAQQKHGFSKMTNFFYASYITAGCRVEISEKALMSEKNVIEIATDGIYTTKKLNIKDSSDLGSYETQVYEKGLFLGSGMKQLFHNKVDYTTNIRGISNDRSYNLLQKIHDHKHEEKIMFWKNRPIHLNECIVQLHKKSLFDLNLFQNVGRQLDVNTDKKHHWDIQYKNFEEFLNKKSHSKPLSVKEVDGIEKDFLNKK